MALKTPCQTSGAQFHTHIEDEKISLTIDIPFKLDLSKIDLDLLEKNIHNAMELVLSPVFQKKDIEKKLDKSDKFSDAELKKIIRETLKKEFI